MAADRADAAGIGVAVIGHAALFAVLSLALVAPPKMVVPRVTPVDIQIVNEVGLKDQAPTSTAEPAPSVAPEVGSPSEAPPPEPTPPLPQPQPTPAPPKPIPPTTRPAPVAAKPVPAKPAPPKPVTKPAPIRPPTPTGRLTRPDAGAASATPRGSRLGNDFLRGISDRPTKGSAQAPRAANDGALKASLGRALLQQLRPFWQDAAPSGADVELLRTTVEIRLNRDGNIASVRVVETTGQTASNRNQVRLHQEAAVKAVRLAAPFVFPSEQYDAWQFLQPTLDKRLLR